MALDIEEIKSLALDGDLYAVQELITRLEAAEKDAARYRWLRCSNWFVNKIIHEAPHGRTAHETFAILDETVDAAMKELEK